MAVSARGGGRWLTVMLDGANTLMRVVSTASSTCWFVIVRTYFGRGECSRGADVLMPCLALGV